MSLVADWTLLSVMMWVPELPSAFHMLVFYVVEKGGGANSGKHFCFHDHLISF